LLLAVPLVLVLAGIGVWYAFLRDGGPKDDLTRLQGEWVMSMSGRENLAVIRVEGDRWTYVSIGGETVARVVLNPAADPTEIDLIRLGDDGQPLVYTQGERTEVRQRGVYAVEGDTVKVALAPYPMPRPKALDPAEAPVWVLTRAKK
jgi:uncharacterized protein (TIGR03067 family)